MSYAEYDALDGYRSGNLRLLAKGSPLHLRHHLDHRIDSDTSERKALRAFHCALLEGPDALVNGFAVYPERRGTNAHKQWLRDNPGITDIKQDEWDAAMSIVEAVKRRPDISAIMRGPGEVAVQWVDPESGLTCKALLDAPRPAYRLCVDMKTVDSIAAHRAESMISRNDWHLQAAHHLEGAIACGVVPDGSRFGFLMVEQKPPHDMALYILDPLALELGRTTRARLLATIAECERTGVWPGRECPPEIGVPAWRYDGGLEDEDINETDNEENIP